jgi:hypothetical protein
MAIGVDLVLDCFSFARMLLCKSDAAHVLPPHRAFLLSGLLPAEKQQTTGSRLPHPVELLNFAPSTSLFTPQPHPELPRIATHTTCRRCT